MWHYNFGPYLQHYASKYYNPDKAHEYYEKHKQLKGRNKSSNSNEDDNTVASTVQENIINERDKKLTEEQERYKKEQELRTDSTKRTMEQHRMIMNQRITSIQNMIKRIPDHQKNSEVPKLKALIYKLREDNDKKRKSIQEKYKSDSESSYNTYKNNSQKIIDDATQAYNKEYSKK